jgi:hypothetical protein
MNPIPIGATENQGSLRAVQCSLRREILGSTVSISMFGSGDGMSNSTKPIRVRAALVACLWIGPLLLLRTGWHEIPSENELQYLSYVRQRVEPNWQTRDFTLGGRPTPYHTVYVSIGARLSEWTSLHDFAVAYRVLNVALLSLGFALLALAVGLSAFDVVASFVVLCLFFAVPYTHVGRYGLIPPTAEPNPTAWGLGLVGYALAVRGRWALGAAFLGTATSIHVLVGLQLSLPFLISVWAVGPATVRARVGASACWFAASGIGLATQASEMISHPLSPEASRIYFQRAAHHLDVTRFTPDLILGFVVLSFTLWLWWIGRRRFGAGDERCLAIALV